ncbi:hypothetical protein BD324DRAFT_647505 [Kockovaella imperatae]|uniref:Uncharacterized protein n=1 Tax=Kockovaella imperatae TaxID=4999 RepID=A0A1Y1UR77_9TREE|nr:hypothetical protein BD324DRAFT_647505 [Kockovaella imperatae]ORX40581.1 hypothetical protein BD324DRAFT_647505 [Kockovaella imperatae]
MSHNGSHKAAPSVAPSVTSRRLRPTSHSHHPQHHHLRHDDQAGQYHAHPHHRHHHHHQQQQQNGSSHTVHTANTHSHGSRGVQRPRRYSNVDSLEETAAKRLSSTETFYPHPDAATAAFEAEREQRRRQPRSSTPFARESDSTITRKHSRSSNRSHRSTHSHGSRRSRGTAHDNGSEDESDLGSDTATVGPYAQPRFGPHGEPIEVIGLGRKEPRHRTLSSNNLKPALRNSSSIGRLAGPTFASGSGGGSGGSGSGTRLERSATYNQHKPLPQAPSTYIAPVVDNFVSPEPRNVRQARHMSQPPLSVSAVNSLRSLFSSFTLDSPSTHSSVPSSHGQFRPPIRSVLSRSFSRRRHDPLLPVEDLFTYLAMVDIPPWIDWPGDTRPPSSSLGLLNGDLFGGKGKGLESMSWEWRRRWEEAENNRTSGRALVAWEGPSKRFERHIMEWLEDNVPSSPIDETNRWGSQIFALVAEGYDTLEFHDDAVHNAEDFGLLSWLTGSVLQTATSALHMLRFSSQHFSFHLIPTPRPPYARNGTPHALWEGYGTLALVNKANELDRAMVLEVRPPSVVDYGVMKEFSRDGRAGGQAGWYHVAPQYCVGDAGQANLLQAQVYDSCVQNQVYFFVVTNLKHWVFGHFNANYSKCTVSPIIERKHRVPSVMQCLVAWIVRSADERPRAGEQQPIDTPYHLAHDVPPYSLPPRRHGHRRHVSQTLESPVHRPEPQQYPSYSSLRSQTGTSGPYPYPQPQSQSSDFGPNAHSHMPSMGYMSQSMPMNGYMPPGYYDASNFSPSPASSQMYGQWDLHSGSGQGSFSPMPASPLPGYNGVGWYSGGMNWPGMR